VFQLEAAWRRRALPEVSMQVMLNRTTADAGAMCSMCMMTSRDAEVCIQMRKRQPINWTRVL